MNRNKVRSKNEIRFGSILGSVLVVGYIAVAATFYVGLKHELHAKGTEKKSLERELEALRTENDVATAQIAQITSRSAVQRELTNGTLALVPIPDTAIVRIGPNHVPQMEPMDSLVPVVHQVASN